MKSNLGEYSALTYAQAHQLGLCRDLNCVYIWYLIDRDDTCPPLGSGPSFPHLRAGGWPISKVGFIKYGEGMFNAAAAARRFALKSNSHVALLFSVLFLPPFSWTGAQHPPSWIFDQSIKAQNVSSRFLHLFPFWSPPSLSLSPLSLCCAGWGCRV